MFKAIEIHGDKVVKYCEGHELFVAYYFWQNPNNIVIPITNFSWTEKCYTMLRGERPAYTERKIIDWIKSTYKTMKHLKFSHNDIMLQNIVRIKDGLGNWQYRLIDLEFVKFGGGSFKDWALCNQLINRVLNNTSSNRDGYQNIVSFFRQ